MTLFANTVNIVQSGLRYVVDIDLSKFFDRVNHDCLLARLATRVKDKRVLNYYGLTESVNRLRPLPHWIRRRLRALIWKHWPPARRAYASERKIAKPV